MYHFLSRRNSILSSLSFGLMGSKAVLSKVPEEIYLDDNPQNWTRADKAYARAKQLGRVDDGKVIWRTKGIIYGFKAPESPVPLVRFKGCEQQWVKKISNSKFIKYNSLLTYYSDYESDKVIDGFNNPITKKDVEFIPNWSRVPEGQMISERGVTLNIFEQAFPGFYSDSSVDDINISVVEGTVSFHAKMKWPIQLIRNPYNQDNTHFAQLEDLQDTSISWVPSHGAGQIMMPSMSSIGMDDPEFGQVIWHVEYFKIKSWDELPKDYLDKALDEHGYEFDVSPENDVNPSKLAKRLKSLGYLK